MVAGQDFFALVNGFLGLIAGAAWGSHYGVVGLLIGGIAGFPVGFLAGHLYHMLVLDITGDWIAGLVKRKSRFGVPLFIAYLLAKLGLGYLLLRLVFGWLRSNRRKAR